MKRILVVGEDSNLLASRAVLLAKMEASVTSRSSFEFATHLDGDLFDLVILCYTLSHAQRQRIVEQVRRRWPEARLILIATEKDPAFDSEFAPDAVTDYLQPTELVQAATALLAQSPK